MLLLNYRQKEKYRIPIEQIYFRKILYVHPALMILLVASNQSSVINHGYNEFGSNATNM